MLIYSKTYRTAQLQNFSFWSIIFNHRKLRSDYSKTTAKRYAENVRLSIKEGYYPCDWDETKEEYWLRKLRKVTNE